MFVCCMCQYALYVKCVELQIAAQCVRVMLYFWHAVNL